MLDMIYSVLKEIPICLVDRYDLQYSKLSVYLNINKKKSESARQWL